MRNRLRDISLLIITVLSVVSGASAESSGVNYVLTRTMLNEAGTSYVEKTDCYDGLGRPYLSVDGSVDPQGPVASMVEYGGPAEVSRIWLPVPVQSPEIHDAATIAELAADHYGDEFPYTAVTFDALGRETAGTGPGSVWRQAGRSVSTRYLANGKNTVRRYTVDNAGKIRHDGYYPSNSLRLQKVTDEDGRSVEVYTDPVLGKVLERREADNDTYYVYDSLGRLTFILQPSYQSAPDVSLYAFVCRYDSYGNLQSETVPGCLPTTYSYDRGRRLAFTHTPALSESGRVRFHLYDGLNREVVTGTCTGADMPQQYLASTSFSGDSNSATLAGYSMPAGITLSEARIETVSYYDRYDFIDFLQEKSLVPSAGSLKYPSHASAAGELTGLLMRASDGQLVCEALYYDPHGNVVRNVSVGLDGNVSVTANTYDFADRPVSSTFTTGNGETERTVTTSLTYDAGSGVLLSGDFAVNTGSVTRATAHRALGYDGTGRLSSVSRGGRAGTVCYSRNIRGWITGISGPGFSQELGYTETPGHEMYSSLVSRQTWHDGSGSGHTYTYSYDDLGRLTDAEYSGASFALAASGLIPVPANFSETVSGYTPEGAITGIRRWGAVPTSAGYGLVDDLAMEYEGNRLVSVYDDAPEIFSNGSMDFTDGADLEAEYHYNGEGALVSDANKGISLIEYDDCGYPRMVQFAGGSQTHYVYTPYGQKLREKHLTAVIGVTVPQLQKTDLGPAMIMAADSTDYVGPIILRDGKADMCLYDGGYFKAEDGTDTSGWTTCCYTYDHLGNVRAVVDADGNIIQTLHYYPSGMVMPGLGKGKSEQPYQLGGKEMDPMHGLNWNDFGARRYDPALGMWTSPDPLAGKYPWISPWAYCAANPVSIYDPDGEDIVVLNYSEGQHLAMLIQNENGKWQYYSINGDNMYIPFTNIHIGGREFNDVAVGSWDSPEDFLYSTYNIEDDNSKEDKSKNHFGFTEGYQISTTSKQDEIMRKSFVKTAKSTYNLLNNNCATAVQNAMIEAGIPVSKPRIEPSYIPVSTPFGMVELYDGEKMKCKIDMVPSSAFKSIIKWNHGGRHIHK